MRCEDSVSGSARRRGVAEIGRQVSRSLRRLLLNQIHLGSMGSMSTKKSMLLKCHHAGGRWFESASIEIKGSVFFIEIYMKPLASGITGLSHSDGNELRADSLSSSLRADGSIEDEGVNITVPRDIDKADKLPGISGSHPAETIRLDLACPVDLEDWVSECFSVQGV